ncbi:MAG: succinylglutamate desuccinylase/aspartoacylase family protein [Proteobacteria bacterium]|nr:succinylglutamate desuccinylase/aspartoacylase family protein [Pseudomonadota bacterium]
MKNSTFKICDAVIQPGELVNLALPLPDYNSCTSFYMPIKVAHGKNPGPCILIFSGINGDELNGIEIINRLIKLDLISSLNGTLIAVPIINIPALANPNFAPYEIKLKDSFPGSKHGCYGERIAHIFTQEIFSQVTHVIELTTGRVNDDILPQIYCDISDNESKLLAKKFAAPVISDNLKDDSLQTTASALNIPMLIYKGGEAKRFDESAIHIGMNGIKNILIELNMLSNMKSTDNAIKPIFSQQQDWMRAHRSGILLNNLILGGYVKKNDCIGYIQDPFNADISEPVKANKDGIIVGINRNPLIFEGQNIFKLATFIDNSRAEISLDQWVNSQENLVNNDD